MNQKGISVPVVIISLAVLALIGYGIMSSTQSTDMKKDAAMKDEMMMKKEGMMQDEKMMEKSSDAMMMKDKDAMMQKDAMAMKEAEMMKKDSMMVKAVSYMPYDAAKVTLAAQTGKAVLFFYASWCPTCRAADAEIVKTLSSIPAGVTIFKVDYDSSTDLKQKYGVTTQHTFVQVGAQGNMISSWRGSATVADIVAKIK